MKLLQLLWIAFFMVSLDANEFVISKKSKSKKESAAAVKEDIAELLESMMRQIGKNIQQAVGVQNQSMDMLRNLLENNDCSTTELKNIRAQLEKQLRLLEKHQEDLFQFFSK